MKFKVGDIVRVARKHTSFDSGGEMECWIGKLMTVSSTWRCSYSMKEDKGKWIWDEDCLEPVNGTIIINHNGNTVAAINKSTNEKGIAKCNPSDTFDLYTGSRLALDRLFGMEYKMLENSQEAPFEAKVKETYYNGKVVCVDKNENHGLYTTGKIYEFVDGQMTCDNRRTFSSIKIHSFDEWQALSSAKWLEIKE